MLVIPIGIARSDRVNIMDYTYLRKLIPCIDIAKILNLGNIYERLGSVEEHARDSSLMLGLNSSQNAEILVDPNSMTPHMTEGKPRVPW
jgi:hypothetical protein